MKRIILIVVFMFAAAVYTQQPAPKSLSTTPLSCTFQLTNLMAPKIIKPFGLLTSDNQDNPVLVRKPNSVVGLPSIVTSTPCTDPSGNLIYTLSTSVAKTLFVTPTN